MSKSPPWVVLEVVAPVVPIRMVEMFSSGYINLHLAGMEAFLLSSRTHVLLAAGVAQEQALDAIVHAVLKRSMVKTWRKRRVHVLPTRPAYLLEGNFAQEWQQDALWMGVEDPRLRFSETLIRRLRTAGLVMVAQLVRMNEDQLLRVNPLVGAEEVAEIKKKLLPFELRPGMKLIGWPI